MNALLVCGGTAGHINPALAIAEEIISRKPDSKVLFVGAGRAMENRLIPQAGYELVNIKMSGVRRGLRPGDITYNIKTVFNVITASYKSAKLIKSFKPNVVIGTGGYICYPVLRKAAKKRIPAFIHESNAYPGLTVRMLSSLVDKIFVTFEGLENRYKKPERVIYTGTPLRKQFYKATEAEAVEMKKDKPLVVSFWGSLGAELMNVMMTEFIKMNLADKCFRHVHAAGNGYQQMESRLITHGLKENDKQIADIREYINDMPAVMKEADLVLCRAGASTIAELTTLGKPAILVPSPYVADNHQHFNANMLQNTGGVVMLEEKDCTGKKLYQTVTSLLKDSNKLEKMSTALKSLSVQNAASKIVDIAMSYYEKDTCTENNH
jgi:UDP-N-acetylglucosamine--N-acetylmuramyl-(pentapeptide) pyrophosphoryl-undecaprenol N-acetylglucosamine transferase